MDEKQAHLGVLNYHRNTKHNRHRMAPSPGYMDWANQPDPFRLFHETKYVELPFHREAVGGDAYTLFQGARKGKPFTYKNLAAFLERTLALSAWKGWGGNRWSLRMHPSSGNLHPTEAYLIVNQLEGLNAGVYHYQPLRHILEERLRFSEKQCADWKHLLGQSCLIGLTSIFWRESWKYGLRAYRYCQLDLGHILAQLSLVAAWFGWQVNVIHGPSSHAMASILGTERTNWYEHEAEMPEVLCSIQPRDVQPVMHLQDADLLICEKNSLYGRPNPLSREHVDWPGIEHVHQASLKPETKGFKKADWIHFEPVPQKMESYSAEEVVRKRRSAVAYSAEHSSMPFETFLHMLDACLPRENQAPFSMAMGQTYVNLFLFVHRVEGLIPGIYAFLRREGVLSDLRVGLDPDFEWKAMGENVPLYRLKQGDMSYIANKISCNQAIAGDSAFSLGMLASFENLKARAWLYPRLFWEAGAIGQVLYLQAEALGYRGTGIGCYFDDEFHGLLGIRDERLQSVYHFTVGTAIEDERLETLPPYYFLDRA